MLSMSGLFMLYLANKYMFDHILESVKRMVVQYGI